MTDDALVPGTRLGELEIECVLGMGGFGITYLARDVYLDASRAVKEYLPRDWGTRRLDGTVGPRTAGDDEDYRWGLERFVNEARILARFKSEKHILSVHRFFEANGTAYLVTEYVEGRTLAEEVKAEGLLSEARTREVLFALTEGLSEVHEAGLLHRDIKPGNVMMRADGTPVLIDFGSARQAMGRHSRSMTAVLTPGYAPIEQYSPRGNQGPWTDIYALGAIAYWALSGRLPDDATERVRTDGLSPLAEAVPGQVSKELAAAVDAALAVNEEDRPQSLEAWRTLLEGSATDSSSSAFGEEALFGRAQAATDTAQASARWLWLTGAGVAGLVLVAALTAIWSGAASDEEGARVAQEQGGADESGAAESLEGADAAAAGDGEQVAVGDRDDGAEIRVPQPTAVERALGLDRAERRVVQEGLAASGFDPGLADGVFGPSTRAALRAWQASRGAPSTGYLDGAAVAVLRSAAEEARREAADLSETSPPAEPEPVRVGGNISPPTKIRDVPPVYPPVAQNARVQGVVILEVVIGPTGSVTDVEVLRSVPLLDEAAINAVKQWRYTPTLQDGVPVPVIMTVTVNFQLS